MTGQRSGVVVSTDVRPDAVVLSVAGELDMASATDLMCATDAIGPLDVPVTVDIGGLTFIDSAGLRALLAIRQRAQRPTQPLRLTGVSDEHYALLELCGLIDAFDIHRQER